MSNIKPASIATVPLNEQLLATQTETTDVAITTDVPMVSRDISPFEFPWATTANV